MSDFKGETLVYLFLLMFQPIHFIVHLIFIMISMNNDEEKKRVSLSNTFIIMFCVKNTNILITFRIS